MKPTLANIQQYASDAIANDPTLSTLGAPIKYSFFTADDAARAAIQAALAAKGVCFEIGPVGATGDTDRTSRAITLNASFDVFVAESPKVAHSPSEMTLVEAVAAAIQKRLDAYTQNARCTNYESALSENGYVLHVLSFTTPLSLAVSGT